MAELFAGIKTNQKTRAALLAGTMMSVMAVAPASIAADGHSAAVAEDPTVLAQAVIDPDDPRLKGEAPPPKGQPPAAIQPAAPPPVRPKGVEVQPPAPGPPQPPCPDNSAS